MQGFRKNPKIAVVSVQNMALVEDSQKCDSLKLLSKKHRKVIVWEIDKNKWL